ncbi:MAG: hypothetical protein K0R85_56 [Devosia sp.]|nr:hypothetical protein [Devosia sp.]
MQQALRPRAGFEYIGVKPTKGYDMLKKGELPSLVTVSGKVKVFMRDELDAFLAQRVKASRDRATSPSNVNDVSAR